MALIGERSTLLVLAIAIAAGVAVIATTKGVPIVIAARAITIGPRRLQRNQPLASRISVTYTAAASDWDLTKTKSAQVAQSRRLPEPPEEKANRIGDTLRVPKVLIIEDNLRYALQLMRALKETPDNQITFDVDVTPDAAGVEQFLKQDDIDIYIVDLGLEDPQNPGQSNFVIGRNLVSEILERSKAGVVVHSSLPAETEAPALLDLGADDYIEKISSLALVRSRISALWRRVQMSQPATVRSFGHSSRTFLVGPFQFTIGDRQLRGPYGQLKRLTTTEHAILRYLCVVDENELSKEALNTEVLGRQSHELDKRVDNYIYRLRSKLGPGVQLISKKNGNYQLLDITELTPT